MNTTGKKFGGRKKGTPNHTTKELRNLFADFVNANISTLQADFDKLEPKDRLLFMERLARLILPPPVHELETLTDEQLDELINRLKNGN